jgi:hypothetical protein
MHDGILRAIALQSEFCSEATLRFGVDDLRQSFEHYDRLVSARHHGFCNGDEFILLAEYTQPRRLRFTAIELRRRQEAARRGPAEAARA